MRIGSAAGDDRERRGIPIRGACTIGREHRMRWLSDQVVDHLRTRIHMPDLSGTRYRALREIGSGGMGSVWLVEDTTLTRQVALKIVDAAVGDEPLAARLLREAEILASLEHPGIVPIHD